MFEFIKGKITDLTPAYAVVESAGIGYYLNISLTSFSQIQDKKEVQLYTHLAIREDAHVLYGFTSKKEREVFRLLISVSGVGPNTARMMLSSLVPDEVARAISQEDVNTLKTIKGIGAKSAQRIIVDLKDKIQTEEGIEQIITPSNNTLKIEALSALDVLGFPRKSAEKAIDKLLLENPELHVEDLIKKALKIL
ncbi:MAG TPA: Holliday junction branch migration protein RuvA [Bacteroidales bacterium]|nr:Holliday junction branch migration protein RuvA [Bacteroidales bacterium]